MKEEIFQSKTSMDTSEVQQLMSKLGLETTIIDLSELGSFDGLYAYVHTGQEENEFNSGITNHWLGIYGNYLFDSYGKYGSYQLPPNIDPVDTVPRALQAYDTNVCGMYVAAFLKYCSSIKNLKTDPGRGFSLEFDFDHDKKQNDRNILDWSESL